MSKVLIKQCKLGKCSVTFTFSITANSCAVFSHFHFHNYRKLGEGAVAEAARLEGNRLHSEVVEHVEHRCEPW